MANNKQFFRIEGDAVHLVTERIEKTVDLVDLFAEVNREIGIYTPILPLGCRMFNQKGEKTLFVIEQGPTVRNLIWTNMDDEKTKWKLAFPYIVFVIVFRGDAVSTDETKVFYRTSPLNGEDNVYKTNLCNVYDDGHICTGNFRVEGETLSQKAESFVNNFWKSEFNSDLRDYNFTPISNKIAQLRSLKTWEEETQKNHLFPLGIKWFSAGKLAEVIERR